MTIIASEISVVPDFVFGLGCSGGARRNYMVEIDRGTMPVMRYDPDQTSIPRKMRVYLAAHAGQVICLRHRELAKALNLTSADVASSSPLA